jgi:hypothetical protein
MVRIILPDHRLGTSRTAIPPVGPDPIRRAVLVPLLIGLSLVTALALVGAGLTLATPGMPVPASGSAAAHDDLVRDFYAAVNQAIQTGDTTAVTTLVAPEVQWCHRCPSQRPSSAGLRSYLLTLHQQAPHARLVIETVVANAAGTVMAQVAVTGFPLLRAAVLWGPVDTFHLEDDRIVARHSSAEGTAEIEPLLKVQLSAFPPAVAGVVMARLSFPTAAGVSRLLSAGPTLVVMEVGTLAVRVASGGRIWRAGEGDPDWSIPQTGTALATVVHQGDAVMIPAWVSYDLTQQGTGHSVALGLTFVASDRSDGHGGTQRPELPPFLPVDHAGQTVQPRPLPAVQFLASGAVDARPAGPVTVALGRAILRPGAEVVPADNEVVLLAVEAGRVQLGNEGPVVGAGEGLMPATGDSRAVQNPSEETAILLMATVTEVKG